MKSSSDQLDREGNVCGAFTTQFRAHVSEYKYKAMITLQVEKCYDIMQSGFLAPNCPMRQACMSGLVKSPLIKETRGSDDMSRGIKFQIFNFTLNVDCHYLALEWR